jgi:hypothetical protein
MFRAPFYTTLWWRPKAHPFLADIHTRPLRIPLPTHPPAIRTLTVIMGVGSSRVFADDLAAACTASEGTGIDTAHLRDPQVCRSMEKG